MPTLRWRRQQRVNASGGDIPLDEMPLVPQHPQEEQNSESPLDSFLGRLKKGWVQRHDTSGANRKRKRGIFRSSVEPNLAYPTSPSYRHRDAFDKIYVGPLTDRYLSPVDGSLVPLIVQTSNDVLESGEHTWKRVQFDDGNEPLFVASLPYLACQMARRSGLIIPWLYICVYWLISCILLLLMMPFYGAWHGKETNHGKYDRFLYKYRGYPKFTRNSCESRPDVDQVSHYTDHWRPSFPRFLCLLAQPEASTMEGVKVTRIHEVINNTIAPKDMAYAYIAMTSTQFNSVEDFRALHKLAERATRDIGLGAYWVAISCMPEPELLQDDVYNIDSYCRNASMMIVALGNKINNRPPLSKLELFRDFGNRLWCRPYILHSPLGARIRVYFRGEAPESHLSLTKRGFALLAFTGEDTSIALRLLDHQAGKIRLGSIEYFVLCVKFLIGGHTSQYLYGDLYYVLMGTLPRRPIIDPTDNAWQAFCRLCMANENDKILERLVCHLGIHGVHWAAAHDAWGVPLWDIHPYCLVAGISHDSNIILDGAYATTIKWDSFANVDYPRSSIFVRQIFGILFRSSPLYLFAGLILKYVGPQQAHLPALVMICVGTFLIISAPLCVRWLYRFNPKSHSTQPRFFGIEGYVPLDEISASLFGEKGDPPRLRWSACSSMLSRRTANEYGECEGIDPTSSPEVATLKEMSKESRMGEPKMFTLVDTGSMTVTLFMARRPPVAILCCGQEGGMHRALLCSFDWTTSTLYRETVLRLDSTVVDRMSRVGKVQLCPVSTRRSDYRTASEQNGPTT